MSTPESQRVIPFREALDEGLLQAMERDSSVVVLGCGVDDCNGIFGTTVSATRRIQPKRVLDVPISENAIAGIGVGMALRGMKPLIVHARMDFLMLTMDQMVNHASKWRYMSGGRLSVPLTVRAVVGRGWGQAAQHSQSLQAMLAHVPGLKVVMPANAHDAKGLLIAALEDPNPVILVEHRWLFERKTLVPKEYYSVPIGKGRVVREGRDVTIAALSLMVDEALLAAEALASRGIDAEVLDMRSVRPLDRDLLLTSVRKTGRLVAADTGWKQFGATAEIAALAAESVAMKAPVARIGLPDAPTPCSSVLEKAYYPGPRQIEDAVLKLWDRSSPEETSLAGEPVKQFTGPF